MDTSHKKLNSRDVPEQPPISWAIAFTVSWGSLRRRLLRSLITMLGVILAIAFLAYMLITQNITNALLVVNDAQLNILLQDAGVDIFAEPGTDQMMILLISLSLFTCLVGIVNSMLMSVTERVKEIGTLKCLGALDSFIIKIYLIESTLQGILGTLLGGLIGLVVAVIVSAWNYHTYTFTHFPILPIAGSFLVALLVGSGISIAASIIPAYMAAKKQPVEAMRVEE